MDRFVSEAIWSLPGTKDVDCRCSVFPFLVRLKLAKIKAFFDLNLPL